LLVITWVFSTISSSNYKEKYKNGTNRFVTGLSQDFSLQRSQWYQWLWSVKIGRNHWVGV